MRVNITAKIPAGTGKEEFRLMLQSLLEDRFQMAAHREKRDMPAFELALAPKGEKLSSGANPFTSSGSASPRNSEPLLINGAGIIQGANISADALAKGLSDQLGRPVENLTGLKGTYAFTLKWEEGPRADIAGPEPSGASVLSASDRDGDLIGAVEQQLGLRLIRKKIKTDIIVIDRIDRTPTGN